MASEPFSFTTELEEHNVGIALWDVPARPPVTKVAVGEEFNVEIAVLCFTKGCNLMGKTIQVVDENFDIVATGKTTDSFFNLRYMKTGYRGRVKVKAPSEPGTYRWYGQFPAQSPHASVRAPLTLSAGRGFPSADRHPLF